MSTMTTEEKYVDFRLWQQCALFLFACAILILRRPDALFQAQFRAEDGHVWFADAYNLGWWAALFRAQDGYYQTFPRLGASLALLAPLAHAPLVLNLIAVAVQALPVNILLSGRSSGWGNVRSRALMAGIYLVLPNCWEMCAIITSSQWVLALSAFLLITASPPKSAAGRLFDIFLLLLSGLTGPFCLLLLPIAVFLAWSRPDHWRWITAGLLAALSLVQAWALLVVNPTGRSHYAAIGANPALFVRLLGAHVYLGTLLGGNRLAAFSNRWIFLLLLCAAVGGTVLVAICFAKSTVELKLLIAFSAVLLTISLISPNTGSPTGATAWEMLRPATGIHYWYFPTVAFAWSLLWCFQSRNTALKTVSAVLLCLMCIGIVRDFQCPAFRDMHFAENVMRFEAAPPGTIVTLPEYPEGWTIRLVKRLQGQ